MLYSEHAPYHPLVGQEGDEAVLTISVRGENYFILQEGEEQLQFRSLEGLHGFRLSRLTARQDTSLLPPEPLDALPAHLRTPSSTITRWADSTFGYPYMSIFTCHVEQSHEPAHEGAPLALTVKRAAIANLLQYVLAFYLTYLLTLYLAYLLVFYLAVEVQQCTLSWEGPRLRSSGAHWAGKVPGWGPVVHTELGRSQVEVQRCTLSWFGPRLRSTGSHWAGKLAKSLAKSWQGGSWGGSWCRHDRGETGRGGRGGGEGGGRGGGGRGRGGQLAEENNSDKI